MRASSDMTAVQCAGLAIPAGHFIDNRRVDSPTTFEVRCPIDGSVLGHVAAAGEPEMDQAVEAARRAFPAWSSLAAAERGVLLRRLADLIERDRERLALVETLNNGSLLEAGRLRVMKRSAQNIRFFADLAEQLSVNATGHAGRQPAASAFAETEWTNAAAQAHIAVSYDPAGVTALITPWNAPLMLATWKVGPALAAGNTVVLKPAEWTPLTASLLADLALEAGLPPGVLNVVQGFGPQAGAALVAHPQVRRISFTGSPETARAIGLAAARNLTPVSFELGGKSPLIVFDDAEIDLALRTAAGQYDNAGQVCLAGTRLLVQQSIYPAFLDRLTEAIGRIRLGDPREPATQVGPLISPRQLERVDGFVQRAIGAGARLVCGGRISPLGGLYYEPTLFADIPAGAEILEREVFGPVLTIQPFRDEEEAVQLANGTAYGLAATLFTGDDRRARRVSRRLVAGTVWVNCFFIRDLAAPFGGARQSGIGREGGHWSFDFYCNVKATVRKLQITDCRLRDLAQS